MFKRFQQLSLKMVGLVNSPGKTQRIMRDATVSRMILKDFFDAAQFMDAKKYFAGSLGEISLRAGGGKMLVSSRGFPLGRLNEAAILTVGLQGNWKTTGLNLPEHVDWHRAVYAHSDAKAAVLCQPICSCVMANKGQLPAKNNLVDAGDQLGELHLDLPDELEFGETLGGNGTLLVQGVGVFVWGEDLNELLTRLELLERWCAITIKLNNNF